MKEYEIKKYQRLNELAEQNGIVIFGGNTDITLSRKCITGAFRDFL